MNYFKLAKLATALVASYGAGIIVTHVIANNVPVFALPTHKKIAVAVGGVVIGLMVKDAVKTHVNKVFDESLANYIEFKKRVGATDGA